MRVVRLIARLNVGGPAIQAITLSARLRERGYETTLVRGVESVGEGTMDALAVREGVAPVLVSSLHRALGPRDLRALVAVVRILRRERPDVLHTHTAKAGTVGRVAALVPGRGRPKVIVHTFHGHVFAGYFSPRATRVFLAIERFLARRSTCLIAVSDEVRDDLLALGVASADKVIVVPLGFELERFAAPAVTRTAMRAELGLPDDAPVVLLVARLVPIKRVDRFLEIAAAVTTPGVRFLVAGDGELRDAIHASPAAALVADRVTWLGMRSDVERLLAAADLSVLCSDNEGTPVSLIESQAAGVPVVSTAVGGVSTVVVDGETGLLVTADDVVAFAAAIDALLGDPERRAAMAAAGRAHVGSRFTLDRLVDDIDALYRRLLVTT